jgi:hypothetical protein
MFGGLAHAGIIREILHGPITSGVDQAGLFSAPNTNLTGHTLTIQFIYDTGLLISNGTYSTGPNGYEV